MKTNPKDEGRRQKDEWRQAAADVFHPSSFILHPLLALMLLLVGCASLQTRSYDLTVQNDSTKPVTVWLTKNGPAWEAGWKSPEDLAIESPGNDEPIAGVIVPPGKTAATGKVTGKFAPRADAILRVYLGQKRFNELLAVNRGSPDRIDIVLVPGDNLVVVADDGSGVKASRAE